MFRNEGDGEGDVNMLLTLNFLELDSAYVVGKLNVPIKLNGVAFSSSLRVSSIFSSQNSGTFQGHFKDISRTFQGQTNKIQGQICITY